MSTHALLLVLGSAFSHALWNALLKREPGVRDAALALQALTAAVGVALALLVPDTTIGGGSAMAWSAGAGLFEAGYFLTLAGAFARGPLGLVYVVARGGSLLVIWPLSIAVFHEPVTATAAVGVGLLVLGLVASSGHPGTGTGTGTGTGSERGPGGALGWASLCALCIAGYSVCYKQALGLGAAPLALNALAPALSLAVVLACSGRRGLAVILPTLRARALPMLVASAFCTLSFLLVLLALRAEGAGAVMTLRNTSVLFALGFSALIGERPGARQVAGGALVAAGAVLVGWPR